MRTPIAPVPEVTVLAEAGRVTPRWFDWFNRLRDAVVLLTTMIHVIRGAPNGVEAGSIGHVALRLDGGAGSTLYVKESGAAHSTNGWVGK